MFTFENENNMWILNESYYKFSSADDSESTVLSKIYAAKGD